MNNNQSGARDMWVGAVERAYLRGEISEEGAKDRLRYIGIDGRIIEELIKTWKKKKIRMS